MFWNKKEEQVEEPKKELVIRKRIKTLYDKLIKISDTKLKCDMFEIEYYNRSNKDNCYVVDVGYTLNTKYGIRKILIKQDYSLHYGADDLITYSENYLVGYDKPYNTK